MIHDQISNYKTYKLGKSWDAAFDFLTTVTPDTPEKTYELEDGMFAIVESYTTKGHEQAVLETHKKYIDIQVNIDGDEVIEWFDADKLEIKEKYNDKRDVTFYHYPKMEPLKILNRAGTFSVLWPSDAHMPQLNFDTPQKIKKVVIKVPVELF